MDNQASEDSGRRNQWHPYGGSRTTMGAIFAGIVALFIAGVAVTFIYTKNTRPMQTASVPATSIQSPAPPIASASETTGSGGGINYNPPKQDPREDEQRERP